jgi:general secretion pathway protein G
MKNKKWFTLVELIVVIVILAILATIAFLSFSSQSASARDSTRLADLNNIAKWLSMFNVTAWSYPKPDSFITITASWNIIWYQWKAWGSVLNIIKISNWGKDPLDTSTYYTYSTNATQSKFQMLWFLEDWSNSALTFVPKTFAADYSKRFAFIKWDGIGILLSSWTLEPVENQLTPTFTWVDITSTSTPYILKYDKNNSVSGTGVILKAWVISAKWMIWYWDMETLTSSGNLKDISGNGNDWTISWATSSWWKLWNARLFNWTSDYIDLPESSIYNFTAPFSISSWIKETKASWYSMIIENYHQSWIVSGYQLGIGVTWIIWLTVWRGLWYGIWTDYQTVFWTTNLRDWQWHFITWEWDWNNLKVYVDWMLQNSISWSYAPGWYNGNIRINMWKNEYSPWVSVDYLKWYIDEVRIYNRAITDLEISTLYNFTK